MVKRKRQKLMHRLYWVNATLASICFVLWILNFEGQVNLGGLPGLIGALGVLSTVITYICNLWLSSRQGGHGRRYLVVYGLIVLGCFAWMLLNYRTSEIYYFPDTWEYISVAQKPFFSTAFFQAIRAPTLPIFLKLFQFSDFQQPTAEFLAAAKVFTQFQSLFALFAAVALGSIIAWMVEWKPLKPMAFLLVLVLSLSTHISMWNKIVYAESLSTTFFFLFTASMILGNQFSGGFSTHITRTLFVLFLFAFVSILFVFARDSNAYLALMVSLLILAMTIFKALRKRSVDFLGISLSLILAAAFLLGSRSAQGGQRWLRPNLNVFHQRIVGNQTAFAFYVQHGLPYDDHQHLYDLEWREFTRVILNEVQASDVLRWFQTNGLQTYYQYLLSNPLQSLALPIKNGASLLIPDSREYQLLAYDPPSWIPIIDSLIYPTLPLYFVIWSALVFTGLVYLVVKRDWDDRLLVPTILMITIYPLMFLIYHGDELEIERHALGLAIQYRVALIMLTILLVDKLKYLLPHRFQVSD